MTILSSPTAHAPYTIGVDLGGTKIEAIVLAPDGTSLWRQRVPTPTGDYAGTLTAVAALVSRAERELGLLGGSVGIGAPGTLTAAGLVKNSNSTCLNGQPLQADLERVMQRPVRVANDANCLALSEAADGAAAGANVTFAVIIGTGVGAGIVVNGRALSGPNGLAGEWGHNPLPWATPDELPGPACFCGQSGCIETWLSGPGLANDHARHNGGALTAEEIGAHALRGDPASEASLQRYEARLARALAHVINLLDPDVIVLAGGVSKLDRLVANVPKLWGRFVFGAGAEQAVHTRLVVSRHGDSSGVRGAAWLWREA
jgi:fructokinase